MHSSHFPRDPLGCRCLPAESLVATKGKKLILVMNKVDLVPAEVAEKWRKILQSEYPTIPLQAEGANAKYISFPYFSPFFSFSFLFLFFFFFFLSIFFYIPFYFFINFIILYHFFKKKN